MLTSMRKLSKTWVFKGLMGLLVVSFGIWGIGDMFKGNQAQREVARVGGEKITVQALQLEFQKKSPVVIGFQEVNQVAMVKALEGYVHGLTPDLVYFYNVTK